MDKYSVIIAICGLILAIGSLVASALCARSYFLKKSCMHGRYHRPLTLREKTFGWIGFRFLSLVSLILGIDAFLNGIGVEDLFSRVVLVLIASCFLAACSWAWGLVDATVKSTKREQD